MEEGTLAIGKGDREHLDDGGAARLLGGADERDDHVRVVSVEHNEYRASRDWQEDALQPADTRTRSARGCHSPPSPPCGGCQACGCFRGTWLGCGCEPRGSMVERWEWEGMGESRRWSNAQNRGGKLGAAFCAARPISAPLQPTPCSAFLVSHVRSSGSLRPWPLEGECEPGPVQPGIRGGSAWGVSGTSRGAGQWPEGKSLPGSIRISGTKPGSQRDFLFR